MVPATGMNAAAVLLPASGAECPPLGALAATTPIRRTGYALGAEGSRIILPDGLVTPGRSSEKIALVLSLFSD